MNDLLDLTLARVTALTDGQEFDDPLNTGSTTTLQFFKYVLPEMVDQDPDGKNFPFVLVRILGGREQQRDGRIRVRLIGGLYVEGNDYSQGQADAERLLELLLLILEERSFTPYTLEPDIDWFFGDPEHGTQPHPQYYVTVDLTFTRQATATNRR